MKNYFTRNIKLAINRLGTQILIFVLDTLLYICIEVTENAQLE